MSRKGIVSSNRLRKNSRLSTSFVQSNTRQQKLISAHDNLVKAALSKSFARTEAQMDIIHEDDISPNEESSYEDEEKGYKKKYQNFIPSLANENFGFNDSQSSEEQSDIKLPPSIYSHPKRLSKKQERELVQEEQVLAEYRKIQ